jgi:integrase/recombinase XerD
MKVNRHGQAKILEVSEIQLLFRQGLTNQRDRVLFGVMLFTACRINEACTLKIEDVYEPSGRVRDEIIFRKGNTKGKLATRTIPVIEDLRVLLTNYRLNAQEGYLFPGKVESHLQPDSASRIFRKACLRVNLVGASTHSFRRTALTQMSNGGIPLRVIQEVSGHRNLGQLQRYLEVKPEQVRGAIASLSMLSPGGEGDEDKIFTYPDLDNSIDVRVNENKIIRG